MYNPLLKYLCLTTKSIRSLNMSNNLLQTSHVFAHSFFPCSLQAFTFVNFDTRNLQ